MEHPIDICVSSEAWTEDSFAALEKAVAAAPKDSAPWVNMIFEPFHVQASKLREYVCDWHSENAINLVSHEQDNEDFCAVRTGFGRLRDISTNSVPTKLVRRIMRLTFTATFNGRILRDFVAAMKKVDVVAFESAAPSFVRDKLSKIKSRDYSLTHERPLSEIFELAPLYWNFVDRILRARSVNALFAIGNQYRVWRKKVHCFVAFGSMPSFANSVWWAITNIMTTTGTILDELLHFCVNELNEQNVELEPSFFAHLETVARRWGETYSKFVSDDSSIYRDFVSAIYRSRFYICYCARHLCSLRGRAALKAIHSEYSPEEVKFNKLICTAFSDIILPKIFLLQRLFYHMDVYLFIRYADEDTQCLICLNSLPSDRRCRSACPRALYCKATSVCKDCVPLYFTSDLTACPVCRTPIADPKKLL